MQYAHPGRADMHIHSHYSDGNAAIPEILDYASRHTPLDVIAITDHDTVEGALEAARLASNYRVEVVVGEEVTTREGHILGLFLSAWVPPRMSAAETIAAIHAQGGVAIAAHPFLHAMTREDDGFTARMGLGAALRRVPVDGVEVYNSFPTVYPANMRAKRFNARHSRLPELGNSDAHVKEAIGKSYTTFAGHSAADFLAALRDGHTAAHWAPYGYSQLRAYFNYWRESHARESALLEGEIPRGHSRVP
jgi:predicted metal-dependent phosphoesterase TrpH